MKFKPTAHHANADALSRLPLKVVAKVDDVFELDNIFDVDELEISSLFSKRLKADMEKF